VVGLNVTTLLYPDSTSDVIISGDIGKPVNTAILVVIAPENKTLPPRKSLESSEATNVSSVVLAVAAAAISVAVPVPAPAPVAVKVKPTVFAVAPIRVKSVVAPPIPSSSVTIV